MASRMAIIQAYKLISINAPLVRASDDETLKLLIRSWEIAFKDIDDLALGYGVERFIKEVAEVNRSMVISAKLLELCKPKKIPFNEFIVPEVINKMFKAWYHEDDWKKLKAETDPLLWQIIEDYPFTVIRETSSDMLPTIYAQIRQDYKLRHEKKLVEEHNQKLEQLENEKKNILMLEVNG